MAEELGIDNIENVTEEESSKVFKKIFNDPKRFVSVVVSIIQKKISSGEISQSELMEESMKVMNEMKDMSEFKKMFSQMGGKLGKGMGLNMGKMQNEIRRTSRIAKAREKLKKRAEAKQKEEIQQAVAGMVNVMTDEELFQLFEKTPEIGRAHV